MKRLGCRWLPIAAAVAMVAAIVVASLAVVRREAEPTAPAERPELLLLSGLPIAFPEEFTLDSPASPVKAALESRFRLVPISIADSRSLAGHRLLLMAQPQAQPAQILVELDRWVRRGGRVLVLADPALEWPSSRPLGDPTRPALAFADTGLLGHWGLRLDAPDQRGPRTISVDGLAVEAMSPGSLVATARNCRLFAGGFLARCRVGRGEASVIADADFADLERRSGPERSGNVALLLTELERLAGDSPDSRRAQAYPQVGTQEQEKNKGQK